MFDAAKIKQCVTQEEGFAVDEVMLRYTLAVNEQAHGVLITDVTMVVYVDGEMGTTLNVHWQTDTVVAGTADRLYSGELYTARLHELLIAAGFSEDAVEGVWCSESGMQEEDDDGEGRGEGCINYDANEIANEVRVAMGYESVGDEDDEEEDED